MMNITRTPIDTGQQKNYQNLPQIVNMESVEALQFRRKTPKKK